MRGVQGWAPMMQVSTSGASNIICHYKYSGASIQQKRLCFVLFVWKYLFVIMLFCCWR